MVKYKVTLTTEEREELMSIIHKGSHTSQKYRNSYVLLNCDEGGDNLKRASNEQIRNVLKIGMRTIDRIKKRFVEEGLERALERKSPDREYEIKADGDFEARLIAISCGKPPKGYARWSLRLLAEKMVELKYVDSISYETVRTVLKKTT